MLQLRILRWAIWAFRSQKYGRHRNLSAPSSDRDCRGKQHGWRRAWPTPKRIDAHPMCPDSPMRAPILQDPRGRLLARDVDIGGREEVTGEVVTSGVEPVGEGGKNTACTTKDGYCFLASVPRNTHQNSVKPRIDSDLHSVGEKVAGIHLLRSHSLRLCRAGEY